MQPKTFIIFITCWLSIHSFAQTTDEQTRYIDSLKLVISSAKNDTIKIKNYILWDDIIYRFDTELDIKLNTTVDSICDVNLQQDLSPKENRFYQLYKSKGLNNLGSIYTGKGLLKKALKCLNESYIIQKAMNDQVGMSTVLKNIGGIYLEQEDYEESLDYFERSLEISIKAQDSSGISGAYESLGIVKLVSKEFDASLNYFRQSIDIRSKLGQHQFLPVLYINVGSVYEDSGQLEEAKINYLKALDFAKKYQDLRAEAATLKNIGVILMKQGKHPEAVKFGERAMEGANQISSITLKRDVAKSLYMSYKKMNQFSKALTMYSTYNELRDSINSIDNQKAIIRQEFKYQYDKQASVDSIQTLAKLRGQDTRLAKEKSAKEAAESRGKRNEIIIYFGIAIVAVIMFFVNMVVKSLREVRVQKEKADIAYDELEEKNQEILDSINYAKRIQTAILPPDKLVKQYLKDSFILYKPKDIVAGDFYWMEPFAMTTDSEGTSESGVLFAAADCTGHGVPGAMVSVVCNNGLNRSVREYGLTDPGQILDKTREIVISEFEKSEEEVKDGMDIALCSLTGRTLKYSGANNPLWIIRSHAANSSSDGASGADHIEEIKAQLCPERLRPKPSAMEQTSNNVKVEAMGDYIFIEVKAHKQPIGKYDQPSPYPTHTIELEDGDSFYIFSDGYADQFGGSKGKKMKTANFKKLLLSIQHESISKQRELIDDAFEKWKEADGKPFEQLDDVCVIGVTL